jgi:polyhydroxybutyrate depolymerase
MTRTAVAALTLLVVVGGLAVAASRGRTSAAATGVPASSPTTHVASGTTLHELDFQGTRRTYRVHVPPSLTRRGAPLVVALHGGFGTSASVLRQGSWEAIADRHGFVVVAPDGLARSWNAGMCCGPAMRNDFDDVGFVLAVLDDVESMVRIDPRRVFATGISNGGMMAYRLGCEASRRFAAIAPVAATVVDPVCAPTVPVSLLHIHGLADRNVPFEGGFPTKSLQLDPPSYPPVRAGIETFVRADGCADEPAVSERGVVKTERWRGCDARTAVKLITIADGGHSWPGGTQLLAILDPPSTALDATATIWRFFATHPRA